MDLSKSRSVSVKDLCANMSLENEEDCLVLEEVADESIISDFQWCLVG